MFGRRKNKSDEPRGVLAEGVRINGDISFSGKVRIDGEVVGNVKGDFVVFGPSSEVNGNVEAKTVIMFGRIKGNIIGESVEIRSGSFVEGDIVCRDLLVEMGSIIRGKVNVEKEEGKVVLEDGG